MIQNSDQISELVIHQLKQFWIDVDEKTIINNIPGALVRVEENFRAVNSPRFQKDSNVFFSPLYSIHWAVFLYLLSNEMFRNAGGQSADQVYYLNKIMNSVDWYYGISLPVHFMCEHPLGSVLGKATYGDYFLVYQGTTVGGSFVGDELSYPVIGENVVLFSNSSVLGKSDIGNNVMISSGARVINDIVPDNSMVFGTSPNLIIKSRSEEEMIMKIKSYWA